MEPHNGDGLLPPAQSIAVEIHTRRFCRQLSVADSGGTSGLSARSLTDFLKTLGKNRDGILAFMRKYAGGGGNILFDGTDILSVSAKMDFPRMSKTKPGGFAEAINLMMAFSQDRCSRYITALCRGMSRI